MAELGHDVVGIDIDSEKIAMLENGQPPFFEPDLPEILTRAHESGRLTFSTDIALVADCDVHFIGVGTPQLPHSDAADMQYVEAAFDGLSQHMRPDAVIVGKSTVPVGTAQELANKLQAIHPNASLIWNPEFLREGFAVKDTLEPDRVVYGLSAKELESGDRARSLQVLDDVYKQILATGTPRLVTDYATAELVKVSANAFLATKISFINAMAEIAETTGADVTQLADAIGLDERIGRRFLNAGVGFGGGCLPKDIRALIARAEELGVGRSVTFLREVDDINSRRRERVVELATEVLGGSLNEKRVAVLGLTFKPNSDDVRDSPALDVAVRLKGLGADVVATDPQGIPNAEQRHPQINYELSTEKALQGADLVLLVTEWDEYKQLDPTFVGSLVREKNLIDGRNALVPDQWSLAKWNYFGLGRKSEKEKF